MSDEGRGEGREDRRQDPLGHPRHPDGAHGGHERRRHRGPTRRDRRPVAQLGGRASLSPLRRGARVPPGAPRGGHSLGPGFASRFPQRWLAVKLVEKDDDAYSRLSAHKEAASIAAGAKGGGRLARGSLRQGRRARRLGAALRLHRGAIQEAVSVAKRPSLSATEAIRPGDHEPLPRPAHLRPRALGRVPADIHPGRLSSVLARGPLLLARGSPVLCPGPGFLRSLLVDGIIAGVGSVFSFVPLIIILFFLLSLPRGPGYMSAGRLRDGQAAPRLRAPRPVGPSR